MEWCFATEILRPGISAKDAHHVAYAAVSTAWNYLPGDGKNCLKETIRKWYNALRSANMLAEHVTFDVFSAEIHASMAAWDKLSLPRQLWYEAMHWFSLGWYRPEHARVALYLSKGDKHILKGKDHRLFQRGDH